MLVPSWSDPCTEGSSRSFAPKTKGTEDFFVNSGLVFRLRVFNAGLGVNESLGGNLNDSLGIVGLDYWFQKKWYASSGDGIAVRGQAQILVVAFRHKSWNPFKVSPLRSEKSTSPWLLTNA